jgi:predicted nucleic acid-binding protein
MIIIDTNVLSELMKTTPDPVPLIWLALQDARDVFTTAVSQAEILFGIRSMSQGRRQKELEILAQSILLDDFRGRILPFDTTAAEHYATIVVGRRAIGKPVREFDAQIAAIGLSHGASIATRNVRDFEYLGLDVINPWDFRA